MNRNLKNPRELQFQKKHVIEDITPKKDIAINHIKVIDDNGKISSYEEKTVIDFAETLGSVKPVTTKIEYMQQYGTLQEDKIVKYGFARTSAMSPEFIMNETKRIIEENYKTKVE